MSLYFGAFEINQDPGRKNMLNISKEELQETLQQLEQAFYNHEQWVAEVTRTIVCHLPPDHRDVAEDAHLQCRFGQWCYDRPPQALRDHAAFVGIANEHQRMHELGARLLLDSAHESADVARDYDSFRNSLDRLRLEIDTLKHEIEDSQYNRDPLTGAENRVAMLIKLRELHEVVKRRVHPCGVSLMDLDGFKEINDTYGHVFGDEVLATTVHYIMTHLRSYDSVFRYGGDEFLISLANANLQISQKAVERLRKGIGTLAFGTDKSKPVFMTASFGIAQLDPDVSVEEVIHRADMALYAAKASGRNRTCVWSPSMRQQDEKKE